MKKRSTFITAAVIALLLFCLSAFSPVMAGKRIVYVKAGAAGSADGRSWATAYRSLQRALKKAKPGDEIWVAKGTYYPTVTNDRSASFVMKSGVSLYGGFKGTEVSRSQRNFLKNETVLSGNIGVKNSSADNSYHVVTGADNALIDGFTIRDGNGMYDRRPGQRQRGGFSANNTLSRFAGNGMMTSMPMQAGRFPPGGQDGSQGRFPPPPPPGQGGGQGQLPPPPPGQEGSYPPPSGGQDGSTQPPGMEIQDGYPPPPGMNQNGQSAPQSNYPNQGQTNSRVHSSPGNVLSGMQNGTGAGMINYQTAPTVKNCTFKNNRAFKGGAVYNMTSTSFIRPESMGTNSKAPKFIGCVFSNNYASGRGGAVANDLNTHPIFKRCKFFNNKCDAKGGAMYNDFRCSPQIYYSLFAGNSANRGGAIANDGGSSPMIAACTFAKNRASDAGAALYQGTGSPNNPIVTRSIIWGNKSGNGPDAIYNFHDSTPNISYSIVQGGWSGIGNYNKDPQLNGSYISKYRTYGITGKAVRLRISSRNAKKSLSKEKRTQYRGKIVYVNVNNRSSKQDGRSWKTAYSKLQPGLDLAYKIGGEVWVAKGVYKPHKSERSVSFKLRSGVPVYGGFKGTEKARRERDYMKNASVLSGNVGNPDLKIDNSYHVVTGADYAVLDGFKITEGYASGRGYNSRGGGLINYMDGTVFRRNRSKTLGYSTNVKNCYFYDNTAYEGGAVYSYDRGSPVFENTLFKANAAQNGGAVLDRVGIKAVYSSCYFVENHSKWKAGAVFEDYGSRPTFTGCIFKNNSAGSHGGAMYVVTRASQLEESVVTIKSTTFEGNKSRKTGGAIANADKSIVTVNDCLFKSNSAGTGGGAVATVLDAKTYISFVTAKNNVSKQGNGRYYSDERGQNVIR